MTGVVDQTSLINRKCVQGNTAYIVNRLTNSYIDKVPEQFEDFHLKGIMIRSNIEIWERDQLYLKKCNVGCGDHTIEWKNTPNMVYSITAIILHLNSKSSSKLIASFLEHKLIPCERNLFFQHIRYFRDTKRFKDN